MCRLKLFVFAYSVTDLQIKDFKVLTFINSERVLSSYPSGLRGWQGLDISEGCGVDVRHTGWNIHIHVHFLVYLVGKAMTNKRCQGGLRVGNRDYRLKLQGITYPITKCQRELAFLVITEVE